MAQDSHRQKGSSLQKFSVANLLWFISIIATIFAQMTWLSPSVIIGIWTIIGFVLVFCWVIRPRKKN